MTLKVFLVEDNPTIRENLIDALREMAAADTVGFATSEVQALQWLQADAVEWDIAVVDLFLFQGSGLGVLIGIADRPPRRKVVVLSNYATSDIRRRCAELGADAVFDKSNELDDFMEFCAAI